MLCVKKIFFIMPVLLLFVSCYNYNTNIYHVGKYPPIKIITIIDNGRTYYIEAISGHVIVIFNRTTSPQNAFFTIKKMGGLIVSQLVDIRYYLVYVGSGNEANFLRQIKNNSDVSYAFLNTVEYPRAVTHQTAVIDNFNISHGNDVTYALQECGLKTKIDKYNVGIKDDDAGRMSWSEIASDLQSILKGAGNDTPLVINMSLGPGFIDDSINYWTDKNITEDVKNSYRKSYKEGLKFLISTVSEYSDKDFVIIKAAGNEGLKDLDIEILNDLGMELSASDFGILNNHFILVGAEDSRDTKYSNTVSTGNYNSFYTSVDISDLKYKNQNLYGTSFAAPRVACFLGTAINDHQIKATEALKVVKDITYSNPDQSITQTSINQKARLIAINRQPSSNQDDTRTTQETSGTTRSNQVNNLAGTKWEYIFTNDYYYKNVIIEFDNGFHATEIFYDANNRVKLTNLYKYYYDNEKRSIIMYNTYPPDSIMFPGEYYEEPKLSDSDDTFNLYYSLTLAGNKLTISNTKGFSREFTRFYGGTSSTTSNATSSRSWEEPEFWGTMYYTSLSKNQFESYLNDGVRKYQYIAVSHYSKYLGILPKNTLNLNVPYYLIHTWASASSGNSSMDWSAFAPRCKLSLYYISHEGGVHVMFDDNISFWSPSTWFRTSSWSRDYLDLLIIKANNTDRNIDEKIDKLYSDLNRRGYIIN